MLYVSNGKRLEMMVMQFDLLDNTATKSIIAYLVNLLVQGFHLI